MGRCTSIKQILECCLLQSPDNQPFLLVQSDTPNLSIWVFLKKPLHHFVGLGPKHKYPVLPIRIWSAHIWGKDPIILVIRNYRVGKYHGIMHLVFIKLSVYSGRE